jgi:hypothetical protein
MESIMDGEQCNTSTSYAALRCRAAALPLHSPGRSLTCLIAAMVDRNRTVAGKNISLLDLGYRHVGLDGGWNYCYPNNKTFHQADGTPVWCDWAKGRPCQGNVSFPDPQHMVDKAKMLGLSPGWYLNNCGCNEHQFEGEMITTIMKGSVKALTDMGWEGLKLECGYFHDG